MKPGQVQRASGEDSKTVVLAVALWAERDGKWIHIRVKGADSSITTVTNNPESLRRHLPLFAKLRKTLIEQDCWPFGDEGADTGNLEVMQPHSSYTEPVALDEPGIPRFRPIQLRGDGPTGSEIILRDRGRL